MLALQFDAVGSLDRLSLVDLPRPEPAPGEVLVRVEGAGVNPSDVKNVQGRFPYTTLPRIPGRDFAGIVEEGPGHLIGKPVWGSGCELGFTRDGSHAEWVTLQAQGVALRPDCLDVVRAGACGVPYVTAWDALERCGVGAGSSVLVIGGAGAVGRAAVDLARWRGGRILAAVRRPEQVRSLSAAGIDTLLLPEPDRMAAAVRDYFPEGADVVFDTTGFWLDASVPALARFGRIAVIAAPADGSVSLPVLNLYRRGGTVVGVNSLLYDSAACARILDRIGAGFEYGQLPLPPEPLSRPLEEGWDVYAGLAEGSRGKQVLTNGFGALAD